jgi:SAM-dependent methyltransferase
MHGPWHAARAANQQVPRACHGRPRASPAIMGACQVRADMHDPTTLDAAIAPLARITPLAASFHPGFHMSVAAVPLPPLELMNRVGGRDPAHFLYVCDQWAQVAGRLLRGGSHVLDIGAGCGKPARAFLHNPNVVEYVGLDVDIDLVNWSNTWLRPASSKRFLFAHLDVQSDTYASGNALRAEDARFPLAEGHFDFVIAASLFTHLTAAASANYLAQARLACRVGAQLLVSLHIEPTGGDCSGNTDRADYRREYFVELAEGAGWSLAAPLGELAGQEALLFTAR